MKIDCRQYKRKRCTSAVLTGARDLQAFARGWSATTHGQGAQDDPAEAFKQWEKVIRQNIFRQPKNMIPVASLVGFLRSTSDISRSD
jgi:hypothetical protein